MLLCLGVDIFTFFSVYILKGCTKHNILLKTCKVNGKESVKNTKSSYDNILAVQKTEISNFEGNCWQMDFKTEYIDKDSINITF